MVKFLLVKAPYGTIDGERVKKARVTKFILPMLHSTKSKILLFLILP